MKPSGIYCIVAPTREELPAEVDIYIAENIGIGQFFDRGYEIPRGTSPENITLPDESLQASPEHLGSKPLENLGAELNPWTVQLIQIINPQTESVEEYQVVPSSPTQLIHLFNAAETIRSYDTAPTVTGNVIHPRGDMLWEERSEDWLENGPRDTDDVPNDLFVADEFLMKLGIKQSHGVRETDGDDEIGIWGIGDERVYIGVDGGHYIAHNTDSRSLENANTKCVVIETPTGPETGGLESVVEQRNFINGYLSMAGEEMITVYSEHAEDSPEGGTAPRIEEKWHRLNNGILGKVGDKYTPAPKLSPEVAAQNSNFVQ